MNINLLNFIASNPMTTKDQISRKFNPHKDRVNTIWLNLDLWLLKENGFIQTLSVLNPSYNQLFYIVKGS